MQEHLEKIVEKDNRQYKDIMPISEMEAEIVTEIIDIFDKIGYGDVAEIMRKFKLQSDSEVFQELLLWNQNGGGIAKKILVNIKDLSIDVYLVKTISLKDSYDHSKAMPIYKIIINEDSTDRSPYCNQEVVCYSLKERDKLLEELKEKLKYFRIKFI